MYSIWKYQLLQYAKRNIIVPVRLLILYNQQIVLQPDIDLIRTEKTSVFIIVQDMNQKFKNNKFA